MQEKKTLQKNAQKKKSIISKTSILPSAKPALPAWRRDELMNALMLAVDEGMADQVMRIIKAGADIAAKDSEEWTALHHATNSGYTKICILLIMQYAKVGGDVKKLIDAKSNTGWTASHYSQTANSKAWHVVRPIENLSEAMGKRIFNAFMKSFGECTSQ